MGLREPKILKKEMKILKWVLDYIYYTYLENYLKMHKFLYLMSVYTKYVCNSVASITKVLDAGLRKS